MSDNNTLDYYNLHTADFVNTTQNVDFHEIQELFLSFLPAKATLLDFGCGSGRDTKYFIDNGYEVDAMDGSKELCKAATKYTGIQVQHMLFEDFNASNAYDGIWACASILHLKKCELPDMIKRLYQALKRNGVIDMLMKPIHGFMKEKIWITGDVRQDRGTEQWLNIILRKVTTI